MELAELNREEQLALVALMRLTVGMDGQVSEDEAAHFDRVVEAIGEDRYHGLNDEISASVMTQKEALELAGGVTRVDARELIYGVVFDLSVQDTIDDGESALLRTLERIWELEVQTVDG